MDKKSAEKAVSGAVDRWLNTTPQNVRSNVGDAVKARLVQGVMSALYPEKPAAKPEAPKGGKGGDKEGSKEGSKEGGKGGNEQK